MRIQASLSKTAGIALVSAVISLSSPHVLSSAQEARLDEAHLSDGFGEHLPGDPTEEAKGKPRTLRVGDGILNDMRDDGDEEDADIRRLSGKKSKGSGSSSGSISSGSISGGSFSSGSFSSGSFSSGSISSGSGKRMKKNNLFESTTTGRTSGGSASKGKKGKKSSSSASSVSSARTSAGTSGISGLTTVIVSYQPALYSSLPFYIASIMDWWEDVGLIVGYRTYPSGARQIADAVEKKAWDVGGAGCVSNILGGFDDIETIGISSDDSLGNALVGNAAGTTDWPPNSIADRPVAVTPESTGSYVAEACLEKEGFNLNDVTFLERTPDGVIAALTPNQTGDSDADYGALWAPYIYTLEENVAGSSTLCTGDSADVTIPVGLMVRKEFGRNNEHIVAKVLAVFLRGVTYMKKKKSSAMDMMRDFYAEGGVQISQANMEREFERPMFNIYEQLRLMLRRDQGKADSIVDGWYTDAAKFLESVGTINNVPNPRSYITRKYMKMIKDDSDLRRFSTYRPNHK